MTRGPRPFTGVLRFERHRSAHIIISFQSGFCHRLLRTRTNTKRERNTGARHIDDITPGPLQSGKRQATGNQGGIGRSSRRFGNAPVNRIFFINRNNKKSGSPGRLRQYSCFRTMRIIPQLIDAYMLIGLRRRFFKR